MAKWSARFGPGLLVTAAFIGPGTVTTASLAGANFGFALAWTLLFSVLATIVLQEMSARLGLVTGRGLGEAVRRVISQPLLKFGAAALIVAAIAFGNAAFQTGNVIGAALGLEALSGVSPRIWSLVIGAAAFALLLTGAYRVIQRCLIVLVVLMSLAFLGTGILVRPDPLEMLTALVRPSVPGGSLLTVIALIGTTVVPYNLFLHASAVREKWPEGVPLTQSLPQARLDTAVAVSLGGLVTLAIMATAAVAFFGKHTSIENAAVMASQLEPLLGPAAQQFFALGLLAAGLTSAVTAPLAAAYAVRGAVGFQGGLDDWRFRGVWMAVLVVGVAFAFLGERPIAAILFAQAANGVLLPVIAVFLLMVMNRRDLLGEHVNGRLANVLGVAVVLVAFGLGAVQILKVLGFGPF